MNREPHTIREKPLVAHPGPVSIDDLLQNIDPAPDAETERFIASIYADRRESGTTSLRFDTIPPERESTR